MILSQRRLLCFVVLAMGLVSTLSAQVTLSYLNGSGAAASATGQSFTPASGDFPTSSAYLTQMQFQTGMTTSGDVYLDIYTTLSSGVFSGYVGSSTNSQVWETGATKTWSFNDLQLAVDTKYYAVFSSDAVDGGVVNRPTAYQSDIYSGGNFIYSSTESGSLDAGFSATFATSAVPEPSTYAAIAGLVVLGVVLLRRRQRGQTAIE